MGNLQGKTALVTGGTRGIGRAVARALTQAGANVVVSGLRSLTALDTPAPQPGEQSRMPFYVAADLTHPEDVERLFDEAERHMGRIDIVAAVAGTMRPALIAEATVDDYNFNFSVNMLGTFLTLAQSARRVSDGGRIIATSTNLTRLPRARMGLYQASKAGVEQMVFSLARELGHRRITVNAISPGGTDTEMLSEARRAEIATTTPLGRVATPLDIADVAAFLASDESRWINGQVIGVNGGIV